MFTIRIHCHTRTQRLFYNFGQTGVGSVELWLQGGQLLLCSSALISATVGVSACWLLTVRHCVWVSVVSILEPCSLHFYTWVCDRSGYDAGLPSQEQWSDAKCITLQCTHGCTWKLILMNISNLIVGDCWEGNINSLKPERQFPDGCLGKLNQFWWFYDIH